jgi:MtaA/CmuA family methyltransferase
MNSFERLTRRLKKQPVDRPPNFDIFMTFAAHYIRQPLSKYYLEYRVLVDANLAMVENFRVDILQAISDPYREAHDFGAKIIFPEDGLPVCEEWLLEEPEKIKTLPSPVPSSGKRMSDRLEAVRLMREKSGDEIPVMGWVEGAMAEAGNLRGMQNLLMDLLEEPPWLEELLEKIVEVEVKFARAQVHAGAHIIGLGDAVASLVSPDIYLRYALPYEQRIFKSVHEAGALARLHICGNTGAILSHMIESGADIIDLDWMVDMKSAVTQYSARAAFCGNMDPVEVMLHGRSDQVYASTQQCLRDGGANGISAAGCEIPSRTPGENLLSQHRALVDFSS